MNTYCVTCESIRSAALIRGGGAVLTFVCDISKEQRSHLMPGERMKCLVKCKDVTIEITDPQPIYASQEGGR